MSTTVTSKLITFELPAVQNTPMRLVPRPHFDWSLRSRTLSVGQRTIIMGILNVTPDSFSDGGSFTTVDSAIDHAFAMLDKGADIIDVGGESTRPDATPLSSSDEQSRVLPVIQSILKHRPNAVVSIDTYHADTARLAVEAGAEIVNDVSGHVWDPCMSETCADLSCGVVLMHTRGRPREWKTQPALAREEVVPLVLSGLEQQAKCAIAAGVARNRIAVDPGFGFGKIHGENYALLASLENLQSLGFPILVGLSRKSFLRFLNANGETVEPNAVRARVLSATLTANAVAILSGAHMVRVHDVAEARVAADVTDAILKATSDS